MHPIASALLRVSLLAAPLCAQPAFEVASIKPAVIPAGAPEHYQYHMTATVNASRAEFANASLMDLLRTAFRLDTYQFSAPDWSTVVRYDIVAKIPAGASRDQVPEMLQQLLATRFSLTFHRAKQEHSVLALVIAKTGPKLKATPTDSDAPPTGAFRRSFDANGNMQMDIRRYSASSLAELIGRFLGHPIADATGLSGEFDLSLSFSPEDLRSASANGAPAALAETDSTGSSIAASLARLGLKMEPRKLPIDVLYVDHVEKTPTPN